MVLMPLLMNIRLTSIVALSLAWTLTSFSLEGLSCFCCCWGLLSVPLSSVSFGLLSLPPSPSHSGQLLCSRAVLHQLQHSGCAAVCMLVRRRAL